MRAETESMDLRELGTALRRGWRWVLGGALGGLALGVLVLLTVAPRYAATATILLRTQSSAPGSLMAAGESAAQQSPLGGLAEMFSLDSGFETELQILGSRSVVGAVVDSLGLQGEVVEPAGIRTAEIFSVARYPRQTKELEIEFRREGDGYAVSGPGERMRVAPGEPFEVAGVTLEIRPGATPERFTLEVVDFQSAVNRAMKHLTIDRAGGNVAELRYRALDPMLAAAVPNAVIDTYMGRRKTTDRSINQRRYDFLVEHTDTIEQQLAAASDALRRHQESTGLLSPDIRTEAEVEQGMLLQARRQELEVDARALAQVLERGAQGTLDARAVASYPTLIQNGAVNQLLARLSDLEARRTELLDRRTADDPDVQLLTLEIRDTQERIIEIARAFQAGVTRQLAEVERELSTSRAQLASLPAQVERTFQLEREVERLGETLVALQTQLVQARIATIAEGGELRQIDEAEPPNIPLYPRAPLTLGLGLFGGLFFGLVGAMSSGAFGRRLYDPVQVQRLTGLPVLRLEPGAPLLLGGVDESNSVLVIPADGAAPSGAVARRLAGTATLRGRDVVLAELETAGMHGGGTTLTEPAQGQGVSAPSTALEPVAEPHGGSYLVYRGNGVLRAGVRPVLSELEERGALVVAALPPLDRSVTASLVSLDRSVALVISEGATTQEALMDTLGALDRLRVQVLGIVMVNGESRG